jgi:hypothetical protein
MVEELEKLFVGVEEVEKLIDRVEAVVKAARSDGAEVLVLCAVARALDANLRAEIADNVRLIELRSRVIKLEAERSAWIEYATALREHYIDPSESIELDYYVRTQKRLDEAKAMLVKLGVPSGNL